MKLGESYDLDQYERLQGSKPALISVFKLKAIAHRLRHRSQGIQFRRARRPEEDTVSSQDIQASRQPLYQLAVDVDRSAEGSRVVEGPSNLIGLYSILAHPLCTLLVFVPLGLLSPVLGWGDSCSFWFNFLALVPLAKILGDATEELAASLHNDVVSGLLNASFGNAVEMIVSIQALRAGLPSVVKLSLLGSVLSNILLVLGTAFMMGGLTPSSTRRGRCHSFLGSPEATFGTEKEQKFALKSALISMAMLLFSCMTFAIPTTFDFFTTDHQKVVIVSRIGAWIVMSTYVAFLAFQLLTHSKTLTRDEDQQGGELIEGTEDDDEEESASISVWCAVLLMMTCSIVTAANSEILVGVIECVVRSAGLPKTFIGVILLPIAGNACEHAGAIRFAMVDRPGLAIGIAVGSSTQVALLVVPFSVIVASFMDKPLDLNFGEMNTLVVTFSVLVVLTLLLDGRSNWMKGYLLVALYVFIATLYWFLPASAIDGEAEATWGGHTGQCAAQRL